MSSFVGGQGDTGSGKILVVWNYIFISKNKHIIKNIYGLLLKESPTHHREDNGLCSLSGFIFMN